MIVTCTMNTAIDLFIQTTDYHPKIVNRSLKDDIQPNGKGVNVSFILNRLEIPNQATGFIAGFTGEFIKQELEKEGVQTQFVEVDGFTRINVFTKVEKEKNEYKLVNRGPSITTKQIAQLMTKIEMLGNHDLLCVSGSNPQGVEDDTILKMAQIAAQKGSKFVLDTSTKIVLDVLPYHPYLLKPNEEELGELFGKKELNEKEIIYYSQVLLAKGAQNILVSVGAKGAYFFNKECQLYANAPQGKLVNSACAGDSLLGTFLGYLAKNSSYQAALKYSVAAGSSTAFREGLTDFSDVEQLAKEITVIDINGGKEIK